MDTIAGGGYSLDDLRGATEWYVGKRTKTWLGACWYKPDTTLYFDIGDEMFEQVKELLSCSREEAEWVLKLLKAAGIQIVFTVFTHEEPEREYDEDDDEEEFDDEGWLTNPGKSQRKISSWCLDVVGRDYRSLGLLSAKGLRQQKQIIFRDGCGDKRVFFPAEENSIMAHYAVDISERFEKKTFHQIRLLLRLQVYYLVMLNRRE